jgi:CheY-like chemotaxis protein
MVSLNGLHILFADDATYNMRPTIDALETAGASVDVVTDGTEVMAYLRKHKINLPDVLILDIMMPGGPEMRLTDGGRTTGVEVFKWMQKEKVRIPTVVSTVISDASVLEIFRHDPKISIIRKPYRFDELEREINRVLTERDKR